MVVDTEGLELALHVAGAYSEDHPVAGEVGQSSKRTGCQKGMAVGGDEYHREQVDGFGTGA